MRLTARELGQFLKWREQEGIIGGAMFLMLFGLPIALMTMAFGVWGALRGHKVDMPDRNARRAPAASP